MSTATTRTRTMMMTSLLVTHKKRKLQNRTSDSPAAIPCHTYLLQLQIAVRALNGCFVHDTDGFMDKDKFDVIMPALVDTLDIFKYETSAKEFVFVLAMW